MEDDAADVAASDRYRHLQCGGGQLGVVVLAQGEPRDPSGGQILGRGQVQLALLGGDLGQVPAPLWLIRAAVKSRWRRSGSGAAALSGRVRLRRGVL